MRVNYLVKDYKRMKKLANEFNNNLPKTNKITEECEAVEWALEQIPEEYKDIIFNKVCYDKAYPLYADPSTYSRWKCRFLYYIAEKLKYF